METSWVYDCTVGGDAEAISQEDWARSRSVFRTTDRTLEGVVFTKHSSYSGLLAPSAPGGNVVRIASGAALVNGYEYYNDANVDFDVSGGAASATDLIVLRSTPASGLVRLALVRGSAGGTATVTQNDTTWEIAIAEVTLDSSGDFSSLTDVRRAAHRGEVKIAEFVLAANGAVSFTSIPGIFQHLRIVGQGKGVVDATVSFCQIRLNGDTGSNYSYILNMSNQTSVTVTPFAGQTSIQIGSITASASGTGQAGDYLEIVLPNYRRTTLQKSVRASLNMYGNGLDNNSNGLVLWQCAGWWASTAAITQVTFISPTAFEVGSTITLYGIA